MSRDKHLEGIPAETEDEDDFEQGGPLFNADGTLTSEEARQALILIVEQSRASGIVADFSIERVKQRLGIKTR